MPISTSLKGCAQTGRYKYQQGFSLIELSIALTIIGVVVAGGLSLSTSVVERQAYVETNNQMDVIETALAAYVSSVGHLPCPADPALSINDSNFGVAVDCANIAGDIGGVQEVAGNGSNVSIGALPARTLGLRDRFSADDYGNRYTYAVTEPHATSAGFSGPSAVDGAISVIDGNSTNIVTNASYTLISHGPDGKGAYRYETASNTIGCAGGLDAENCDYSNATFRDARFNRGSVAANFNDDSARWKQVQLITAGAGVSSGSNLWVESGTNIYDKNADSVGSVGIGTSAPEHKLEVQATAGGVNTVSTMVLDSNNSGANAGPALEFKNSSGGYLASIEATQDASTDGLLVFRTSGDGAVTNTNTRTGASVPMLLNRVGSLGVGGSIITGGSFGTRGVSISNGFDLGLDISGVNQGINIQSNGSNGMTTVANSVAYFGVNTGAGGRTFSGQSLANDTYIFNASASGANSYGGYFQATGTNSYGGRFRVTAASSYGMYAEAADAGTAARLFYTVGGVPSRGCDIGASTTSFSCSGNAFIAGNLSVIGNITATGSITPSDGRLKKDVSTLLAKDGLKAINALRPVRYHWKDKHSGNGRFEMGFIAQELEAVLPELVYDIKEHQYKDVKGTIKAVQYERIIAPMVLAIQQLSQENKRLKQRLDALEARHGDQ